MRSIDEIAAKGKGAALVTETELAMLCAFAKRAEKAEAEVERLRESEKAASDCYAAAEADVERLTWVIKGAHGALTDAATVVVPGTLDGDLAPAIRQLTRERDEARAEVERSHKAILALTGEVERLRAQWDVGVRAGMTATAEQQGRILALEAEVERQVADYGRLRGEMLAAVAEKWRALKALVEAGDLIATWCPPDHRGVWDEAKRKAGL